MASKQDNDTPPARFAERSSVEDFYAARFASFQEGQPISIRMLVTQTLSGTTISLIDAHPEKRLYPTFADASRHA